MLEHKPLPQSWHRRFQNAKLRRLHRIPQVAGTEQDESLVFAEQAKVIFRLAGRRFLRTLGRDLPNRTGGSRTFDLVQDALVLVLLASGMQRGRHHGETCANKSAELHHGQYENSRSQPRQPEERKPLLVTFAALFYHWVMNRTHLLASLIATTGLATVGHADWLQFRGPAGAAVATGDVLPGEKPQIVWKATLPGRGLSSPVVIGDRLFITCSSGPQQEVLHVICFSATSGEMVWQRTMRATGRTMSHNKTCVAAPTPCSDGTTVFALFSSNDLFAFDLEGKLKWLRGLTFDYANASNSLGMSQSPTVLGNVLVVQSENDAESFAAGLDLQTGRNVWKLERPKAANWTSAIQHAGLVALQSSEGLLALRAEDGSTAWKYADGASTIPSSVASGDTIYAVSRGITALAPDAAGSVSQLWRNEGLKPGTASPLVLGEHLYVVNNAGVLIQASRKDGSENWKLRLKGPFSGSPVAAGKYIYIASERGVFQVIDTTAKEGEVVHSVELNETVLSTPAISDGALYLRSDSTLWKLK